MTTRIAAWLACAALLFAALLSSLITVVPEVQPRFAVLQAALFAAALFMALVGIVLARLPTEHWGNRSLAVRFVVLLAAISSIMLLAVSVS